MAVLFIDESAGRRVTVAGKPGETLLALALRAGIELEHTCGGVAACSTCHVLIRVGEAALSEATDAEMDQLDLAPNRRPESRLSCQARLGSDAIVEVIVPKWNRNAVKERRAP